MAHRIVGAHIGGGTCAPRLPHMKAEEWFKLKENPSPGLCRVWGCRKKRAKERMLCWQHNKQLVRARNPAKAAYSILRDNAKRRGKEFTLTLEQFTEWATTTGYLNRRGRQAHHFHIDRIDPSKGYTIDNIQPLTCSANTIKGNNERHPF